MPFSVDERLIADTSPVADWPLCRVLLMNDRRFPWLILVPRRESLRNFHDVPAADKATFLAEIDRASGALQRATGAHKMNVAALGNLVPQLHVHIIARFETDAAWPRPVWGVGQAEPYGHGEAESFLKRLSSEFDAR